MNYFVLLNGVVYFAAMAASLWKGHYLWGVIWLGYAVSALALGVLEGK